MQIAAVADIHARCDSASWLKRSFDRLCDRADVLLLGGDLTDHGRPEEARALAEALSDASIPVLAVLGNHDHEHGAPGTVRAILERAGVRVLDGDACVIGGVGFAGVKGFGGGFPPHALGAWGEAAIKAFAREAEREAEKLDRALARLGTPQRVALLHYAPIRATLAGEAPEIHPFLGCSRLGDALDRSGATLACHGHAHAGAAEGETPLGIPVLNVAAPLLDPSGAGLLPAREVEIDPSLSAVDPAPRGGVEDRVGVRRRAFYRSALRILRNAGVPCLVGGGAAMERLTGIARATHDLDLFVRQRHLDAALRALAGKGFETELAASHWLAKAHGPGGDFIDVIFSSGNGVCDVDDAWFEHALEGELLGEPVLLCPVEEMVWMKAFVMERERYDGADVAHLLHAHAERIDWRRLVRRFGDHWRVLLSHLVLFGFVYPRERGRIPQSVMRALLDRLRGELLGAGAESDEGICRGGLLSRAQYLADFEHGYRDARQSPLGGLEPEEIEAWTRQGADASKTRG